MASYKYKALRRDESKCIRCNICETMLSGFITEHEGEVLITPEQYENEETQVALDEVVSSCLGEAITVETIADFGVT